MIRNILDLPDLLIKKGLPFVIYSLPESGTRKLIFQKDHTTKHIEILEIKKAHGFVIADFESAKSGIADIIKPDFILSEFDNIDNAVKFLHSLPDIGDYNFKDNTYISKSNYLDKAEFFINKLKEEELQKAVLSRVIKKELEKKLDTYKLLKLLMEKYNNAFVYLFHIPNKGTWCGASPEILTKSIDENIIIDALAGTRLINKGDNKLPNFTNQDVSPSWSLKEKEEQHYVTLYIESLLSELQIDNYELSDPITVTAGNLAHIQTKFKIPTSAVDSKIGKLIAGLHPTPAVCGLPKAEAFLLIQKAELHSRRYYTGFLGPWNMDSESQLFVNLRCAELDTDKVNIYVGGGLTAASNPEAEYQETVHKSQTLLSVIDNL